MISAQVRNPVKETDMSGNVYLLWFAPQGKSDDDALLIGVYLTEIDAKAAIDRLRSRPGFVDFPEGFQIHSRVLGQDYWPDGFVYAD